ncbi:hypothetical protein OIV83_000388 [Microbotryomycetes sp. JL201]|nr:hypothetical protein OIV83_000388 [Microbotryomycetes sp. JL201]
MPNTTRQPFAVLSLGSFLPAATSSRSSPSPRKLMAHERQSTPRALKTLYDKPPISPARAMMLAEELQMLAPDDDEDGRLGQSSPARRLLDAFIHSSQADSSKRDRSSSVGSIGMKSRSRQSSPAVPAVVGNEYESPQTATRQAADLDKPTWTFWEDGDDGQINSQTAVDVVDLTDVDVDDAAGQEDDFVCSNENAVPPPKAASAASHRRSNSLLSQSVSARDERRFNPVTTPPSSSSSRVDLMQVSSAASATAASDSTVVPPSSGEALSLTRSPPASPPPLYPAWNEPVTSIFNDGSGLGPFADSHSSFASAECALRPAFGSAISVGPDHDRIIVAQQRAKRKSEEGLDVGEDKRPRLQFPS